MLDFKNNEVSIGDEIIFIQRMNGKSYLCEGIVVKISNSFGGTLTVIEKGKIKEIDIRGSSNFYKI